MDFNVKRKNPSRTNTAHIETENLESSYPHNVMLYHLPPTQDITLQTFEDLAVERVNLLRIFEQATAKNLRVLSEDWKNEIKLEMQTAGMRSYLRLLGGHSSTSVEDLQARRKDYISHFILRLAYCRSTELRRLEFSFWFYIECFSNASIHFQMVHHT